MFHLTDIQNVCLEYALDVDMKIALSQNVPSQQKISRNGKGMYVLIKKVIVHATTEKITMTIRYTNL